MRSGLLAPGRLDLALGAAEQDRLLEQHEPGAPVRLVEPEVGEVAAVQHLLGRAGLGHRALGRLAELGACPADGGEEQALLGAEVFVQHRLGQPDAYGDLLHGDGAVPLFGEDLLGDVEHLPLALRTWHPPARALHV